MEILGYIISGLTLLVSFFALWKSFNRDQSELDKEQDREISSIKNKQAVFEERLSGNTDRMNRIEERQKDHEDKVSQELKEVKKEIKELPQRIMELLKTFK